MIVFDTEYPDPRGVIRRSIEGSIEVKRLVEKVGGRYTYLSQFQPNAFFISYSGSRFILFLSFMSVL